MYHTSFARPLSAIAVGLLLGGLLAAPAPAAGEDARLLVQPRPGLSDARLGTLLRGLGASRSGRIDAIDVVELRVPEQARDRVLEALQRNPHISFAEPDQLVPPQAISPDDPYFGDAWHLPQIEAPTAWDTSLGSGRVVAVLDTGVDDTHPDLLGNVLSGYNSVSDSDDASDVNGHGTKVAGVVGAGSLIPLPPQLNGSIENAQISTNGNWRGGFAARHAQLGRADERGLPRGFRRRSHAQRAVRLCLRRR